MRTAERDIAAVLTARGRGAVATIAFCGDVSRIDAAGLFHAANGRPLADQSLNRIAFGRWGSEPAEEVVTCRVAENRIEIHCHGGDAAVARVLNLLAAAQVETVDARRFLKVTEGTFTADASEALAAASTLRTAALIARQVQGPLRELLQWLANADPIGHRNEMVARIAAALAWSEFGRHLTQPWRVVLFGPPNVGKSSLINALVGFERAIVYDQPGTTRDVVTAETAIDGWPIRFSDTAGFRADADELEAAGIERAKSELAMADVCVRVHDANAADESAFCEPSLRDAPLIVFNKCDLPHSRNIPGHALAVSAKTGEGVRELLMEIVERLVPDVPADDDVMPICVRQIEALEIARAALIADDRQGFRRAVSQLFDSTSAQSFGVNEFSRHSSSESCGMSDD